MTQTQLTALLNRPDVIRYHFVALSNADNFSDWEALIGAFNTRYLKLNLGDHSELSIASFKQFVKISAIYVTNISPTCNVFYAVDKSNYINLMELYYESESTFS